MGCGGQRRNTENAEVGPETVNISFLQNLKGLDHDWAKSNYIPFFHSKLYKIYDITST